MVEANATLAHSFSSNEISLLFKRSKDPTGVCIPFRQGVVGGLYNKIQYLQCVLAEPFTCTHWQVLEYPALSVAARFDRVDGAAASRATCRPRSRARRLCTRSTAAPPCAPTRHSSVQQPTALSRPCWS